LQVQSRDLQVNKKWVIRDRTEEVSHRTRRVSFDQSREGASPPSLNPLHVESLCRELCSVELHCGGPFNDLFLNFTPSSPVLLSCWRLFSNMWRDEHIFISSHPIRQCSFFYAISWHNIIFYDCNQKNTFRLLEIWNQK